MKKEALRALAAERRRFCPSGYCRIGDFHDGAYECDHVSPLTKSGTNVDAEVMIIGQDWASSELLGAETLDCEILRLGYKPKLPTNKNLDRLLQHHFRLTRANCYLTNLFPYVKPGSMSSNIRRADLIECAKRFTLEEIEIVSPKIAICLGAATFNALRRATGEKGWLTLTKAIASPFQVAGSTIHGVGHTGALGMNNRGHDQADEDWKHLARTLNDYRTSAR